LTFPIINLGLKIDGRIGRPQTLVIMKEVCGFEKSTKIWVGLEQKGWRSSLVAFASLLCASALITSLCLKPKRTDFIHGFRINGSSKCALKRQRRPYFFLGSHKYLFMWIAWPSPCKFWSHSAIDVDCPDLSASGPHHRGSGSRRRPTSR
jgi:hypothetical protein